MLFNSLEFIIFWIAVVCVYYLIPNNTWRKVFLLAASFYFYACWNVAFLAILLFETALSYGLGLSLGRDDGDKRKSKLCCGIVLLLLPLLCFKYLNFILASVGDIIHATGLSIAVPQFKILLPVGISFYTFMAVGYIVDCYKHKIEAEKNILDYSLFIGFFPQIASGPIGRASSMLPQFKERHPLLYENIAAGAKMMLWGFFMKLVVGDRAGIYVDTVFGNYAQHNGVSLMLATFLYTIQIYCDFAGYSLIAIGTAKTMGYNLMTNFNRPYFSQTIGEFWRRWHISLSTWFRDYVYFPLGGSRCSHLKTYRNLLITFLVSGLWHGAAYNFILWGGYHAVIQIVERAAHRKAATGSFGRFVNIVITFILAAYGWMLFYAPDLNTAIEITKGYFHLGMPYIHQTTIFFFFVGFAILFLKDLKDEFWPNKQLLLSSRHIVVRYLTFAALAVLIVSIGVLDGGQFIYFKF